MRASRTQSNLSLQPLVLPFGGLSGNNDWLFDGLLYRTRGGRPCFVCFVVRGPPLGLGTVPFLLAAAETSSAAVEKGADSGGAAASFVSGGKPERAETGGQDKD